jgi:glycine cleavage system aminomethyltransferase T/glycine/D-amino acid oxidase-like deaminating enzyme
MFCDGSVSWRHPRWAIVLHDGDQRHAVDDTTDDESIREDHVVTSNNSESQLPDRARVVIVGGGVIGASVAYHLTKLGWTDVVLLEQNQLTSGTTWHAAGLVVSGGMTTDTLAWMAKYSRDLFEVLEEETGLSTGFRPVGYLQTASNPERAHKLAREADFLRLMGIEREEVSPAEVAMMWPQLDASAVVSGYFTANEGRADPSNVAMSLAKGARMGGARIVEGVRVTAVHQDKGRVTGVGTDQGEIQAEFVVNCAGMWAKELGAMAGVSVPLQAIEHAYLISEPFNGVSPDLPILEDPDRFAYYREETGGLMVGLFEPVSAPWSLDKIPDNFSFGEIPSDWDRLAPFLEFAMEILPGLENVGIRKLFTGPESFTPDNGFLIGEAPELRNFFVAAGMNSLGILTGGGVGSIIANWIVDGEPPVDITDIDIARLSPFQANRPYLAERSVELLGRLHSTGSWPHSSPKTARNVRRSPIHRRLEAVGAHFVESSGWENTGWFGEPGTEIGSRLTYGRQDWFSFHAAEHHAVRNGVALFDMSAMSKFLVQGRGAESVLNRISGNNVAVPVGQCVYTQWMDNSGHIQADLTITRIGEHTFMVVVAESFHRRTLTILNRTLPDDDSVHVTDVTSAYALISVQGPKSRALLSTVTSVSLSNEDFPYFTGQEIDMHHARGYAFRMSFVGELGWELFVPSEFAVGVYDRIIEAGSDFGLAHAGMETLESARTEAGRRDYGLDMENTDTPLEAGVGFTLDFDKPGGFIGRDALLAQKEDRPWTSRLVQFLLDDPEPLLYGEEPIIRNGVPVGYLRSGAYGHTLGGAMGMGYVLDADGVTLDMVNSSSFEIQVAGERFPATASLRPMYDPKGQRVRM